MAFMVNAAHDVTTRRRNIGRRVKGAALHRAPIPRRSAGRASGKSTFGALSDLAGLARPKSNALVITSCGSSFSIDPWKTACE